LRVKNKEHYLKVVEKLKSKGYTQKGGILDGFSNFPEGLCINVKNKHFFLVAQFRNKLIRTIDNVESIDCKHHPFDRSDDDFGNVICDNCGKIVSSYGG
jgi:hypothetical protein